MITVLLLQSITTISRSVTPLAFLHHRIHKLSKNSEKSGYSTRSPTPTDPSSCANTFSPEEKDDEPTDELSEFIEGMPKELDEKEENNEEEEEFHDRTYFHFPNIEDDTIWQMLQIFKLFITIGYNSFYFNIQKL